MEAEGDLPGQSECSNSSVVASVAWGAEAQERVGPHVHYGERRAVRRIARPDLRRAVRLVADQGVRRAVRRIAKHARGRTRGAVRGRHRPPETSRVT